MTRKTTIYLDKCIQLYMKGNETQLKLFDGN